MENTQSLSNQNLTETTVQQQNSTNNSKLLVIVVISVLLTAVITSSVVYFLQRSVSDRPIDSLEQKVTSLEEQVSVMGKATATPRPTSPSVLSPTPTTDVAAGWNTYTSQDKKYTFKYPSDWTLHDESRYVDLYQDGNTQFQYEVSISKDEHIFKSRNPLARSPGVCLYPDSPDFEGHSNHFNDFVEIKTETTTYRRPKTPVLDVSQLQININRWTVCKVESETGRFTSVAGFGTLHYEGPSNYNQDLVKTMDQILSTFKSTE